MNRKKSSQLPQGSKHYSSNTQATPPQSSSINASSTVPTSSRVQPEQISLFAHTHIQTYLQNYSKTYLEQEDLNAVLRLSQHLRIFGLLSAVGYINQTNDQEGKVRQRTVPVWHCLLRQLIAPDKKDLTKQELMEEIVKLTKEKPSEYMAMWRKSLILTNHWNFWARAYSQD